MPSDQNAVDFILAQIADAGEVSARKMFGEYCLYCDGKVVGSVNENLLFVKPTAAGRSLLGDVVEASPYEGAKPNFLIDNSRLQDRDFMVELIRATCAELPKPKAKKK